MLSTSERREIQLQARRDGKAVYYRNRAAAYRADARLAWEHGATKAADKLQMLADRDEKMIDRLIGTRMHK